MGIDKGLLHAMVDHKQKLSGPHFLFSAENPKHTKENKLGLTHEQVLHHMKNAGYDAHAVQGHYGSPERSILVHGINPEQAKDLHAVAANLGQDSSIYSNGKQHEMLFHHGENKGKKHIGEGTVWHKEKPADYFTTLPGGTDHFTHNFDFSKLVDANHEHMKKSEPLDKSDYGPKHLDLYNKADNARRKINRTGEEAPVGPNKAVKAAPPTLNDRAEAQARLDKQKSKKNPVKVFTPQEIKKLQTKGDLSAPLKQKRGVRKPTKMAASEEMAKSKAIPQFTGMGLKGRPEQNITPVSSPRQKLIAQKQIMAENPGENKNSARMGAHRALSGIDREKGKLGVNVGTKGYYKPNDPRNQGHSVQQHEAFHNSLAQIRKIHGEDAADKIVHGMLSHFHPHDVAAASNYLLSAGYPHNDPNFKEEVLANVHTYLSNKNARAAFQHYARNPHKGGALKYLKDNDKSLSPQERRKMLDIADKSSGYNDPRIKSSWNSAVKWADSQMHPKKATKSEEASLIKVEIPKKDFVEEHTKLLDVLAHPTKKKLQDERSEQSKELKEEMSKAEDGFVKLVHYSPQANLTHIDPKFKGSGVDSRVKGRDTEHPHSFFYFADTEPEKLVVGHSRHKYHTSLDTKNNPIYDIGADPQGFHEKVRNENQGAFNMDMMHRKIKEAGFHGFHNSKHPQLNNVVAMYSPLKVEGHEELG